jgi:hypothetical protein
LLSIHAKNKLFTDLLATDLEVCEKKSRAMNESLSLIRSLIQKHYLNSILTG